jgi:hypothetical protein
MPSLKRTAKGLFKRLLPGSGSGASVPKKKVWRISERAPGGEWVDADSAPVPLTPREPQAERSNSGWLTSSMDLLSGSDVVEDPDTASESIPDDAKTLPLPRRPKDPKK